MDPSMSLQRLAPDPGPDALPVGEQLTVTAVYEAHVDFVWRGFRRLGVPASRLDDAVQDVFLVVHRRLDSFEVRSSVKTWLFGIALRVARDHHRSRRRKEPRGLGEPQPDLELLVDETSSG